MTLYVSLHTWKFTKNLKRKAMLHGSENSWYLYPAFLGEVLDVSTKILSWWEGSSYQMKCSLETSAKGGKIKIMRKN